MSIMMMIMVLVITQGLVRTQSIPIVTPENRILKEINSESELPEKKRVKIQPEEEHKIRCSCSKHLFRDNSDTDRPKAKLTT